MDIRFTITSYADGLAYGTLTWTAKGLTSGAFSGPYGRKELPMGLYHARRAGLLDKPGEDAYCDSLRRCWLQALEPQFSTQRDNLAIHPDGNKVGTLGCIGLLEADTKPWYDAFRSVPNGTVTTVEVVSNV